MEKEIIAMILAGGEGSRLAPLTKKLAKPAVPFGGRYRIIDFTLSNCCNSGIEIVGVLTQYEPHILNQHIGTGTPWDLNRLNGGVTILHPHTKKYGGGWYKGTANAIYKNIEYIDKYDPENVLILSGDHIYKMNYGKMLKFHKDTEADVTIGVISVSIDEASRFGIMSIDDSKNIFEFEEKPKNPKSNLASMGIYIFKKDILKKALMEDDKEENSSNDFGKNIIPKLLKEGKKIKAYEFKGYWKDVGTIESLWEAHMDLLKTTNELDIHDQDWKIYTRQESYPPQYIGKKATIKNSFIDEGCEIEGIIENSIIFPGVKVGKNVVIKNSVIMKNAIIENGVIVNKAIVGEDVKLTEDVLGDKEIEVVVNYGEYRGE
ncbi:glucose-1-phosphate adenylyltransferase [Cetobacterium sp. SF1]|uniref:glucose-1-phosphate adenylyltransferase n=1 Tax=Cetobacterium sp. SF1 TaxID=3417654 RepID=UPI003CF7F3D9